MTDEELIAHLRHRFASAADLNVFLQLHMWPFFKASGALRRLGRPPLHPNSRFCDLDGTPLSDREVTRRANAGAPAREIETGRIMRYNRYTQRWEDSQGS